MPLNAINRWRHRHGFGVHSPAAYRLVTEVVHPRRNYVYYAEHRIDVAPLRSDERQLCLLTLRLYGFLHASGISLPDHSPLLKIWSKSKFRIPSRLKSGDAERGLFARLDFLDSGGEKGEVEIYSLVGDKLIGRLKESHPESIMIESRRYMIIYHVPGLTRLHVTV